MGSDGIFIKAGESVSFDGLTLTPSADFTINSTSLDKTDNWTINPDPNKPYIKRYFKFTNNTSAFAGTIRFSYAGATLTGSSGTAISEPNVRINIFNGSSWVWMSGAPDQDNDFVQDVIPSSIPTVLNTITLASSTDPLPVTWLDFTAQRQANQVLLQWSTASEINTQDFVVQHSLNAADWASLGSIDAAGNSNVTNRYSYIHTSPVKGSNTINYYRILQRDLDGKFSFSKILSLRFEDGREEVLVYPNPAVHTLTMYLPTTQHVRLVNQQGALIWQGQMQAGRNQLQVSHLAKGMYYLLTDDGSHPVVIQ